MSPNERSTGLIQARTDTAGVGEPQRGQVSGFLRPQPSPASIFFILLLLVSGREQREA